MARITTRLALAEDLQTLLALYSDFGEWFVSFDASSAAPDLKKLDQTLRSSCFCDTPFLYALLAELDGKPKGFALYSFGFWADTADKTLVMSALYSAGSGVGNTLMARLLSIASENYCGRMMWNCWDQNHPAISFYEKLGASKIPDEPMMYLELDRH